MTPIQVIKLGGSLINSGLLKEWLNLIASQGQGSVVIVPGGGPFANQVRLIQQQWRFDDVNAHHMAVLAMQQMALVYQGLNPEMVLADSPEAIKLILKQRQVAIWFPEIGLLNDAGIAASWEVTSDSLSAWLAGKISASNLTLVKSIGIPENFTIPELIEQGVVDKAFNLYAKDLTGQINIVNRSEIKMFLLDSKKND